MKRRRKTDASTDIKEHNDGKLTEEERAELLKSRFGYANDHNPFNDARLSRPFVWKKRSAEPKGVESGSVDSLADTERRLEEIFQVRQRRAEREKDVNLRMESRTRTSHERETQNYDEWQRIEDKFHREISRLRIKIHIQEGRETLFHYFLKTLELGLQDHLQYPPVTCSLHTTSSSAYTYSNKQIPDKPLSQIVQDAAEEQLKVLGLDGRVRLTLDLRELEEEEEGEGATDRGEGGSDNSRGGDQMSIRDRLSASSNFWRAVLSLGECGEQLVDNGHIR